MILAGEERSCSWAAPARSLAAFFALPLFVFLAGSLGAADGDQRADAAALLRRLDSVNAEIESVIADVDRRRGPAPGREEYYHVDQVLSAKKNALVSIGGDLRLTYAAVRSNFVDKSLPDPMARTAGLGKSRYYDYGMNRARLDFAIEMGERWRAFIEMNLSESGADHALRRTVNPNHPGAATTSDYPSYHWGDILGEAYVELLKAGHSGFGAKIGRMELPFGVKAKPDLFAKSFLAAPDLTGSYLMTPRNWNESPRLPHASALLDPVMAAMVYYEMRDIFRFEAALFQERYARHDEMVEDGITKYVSRDPAFRSFQLGFSFLPLEDWELSLAYRNRHDKGRGIDYWSDSPYRGDFRDNLAVVGRDPRWVNGQWADGATGPAFGSRQNEQAFIAGLALEIPNTDLSFFAEYAHGWNQGFNRHIHSDDVNLGLAYRLTPRFTLFGQYEWLSVKDRSRVVADGAGGWLRDTRGNHLNRWLMAMEYDVMDGLTLEAGWQREGWHFRSSLGGAGLTPASKSLIANLFYVGTRFRF